MLCAVLLLLCSINLVLLAVHSSCSRNLRDRVRAGIVSGLGYSSSRTEYRLCGLMSSYSVLVSFIFRSAGIAEQTLIEEKKSLATLGI